MVLFCVVGCGDSPKIMFRDMVGYTNELADCMAKIPDDDNAEDAADEFVTKQMPLFKKKIEKFAHRFEVLFRNMDSDDIKELKAASDYWKDEVMAAGKRIESERKRLERIIERLADDEVNRKTRLPKERAQKGRDIMQIIALQIKPDAAVEQAYRATNQLAIDAALDRGEILYIVERDQVAPKLIKALKSLMELEETAQKTIAAAIEKGKKQQKFGGGK
jgi:hypothetical protein